MAQDLFDLLGRIRIDTDGLDRAIQQAEQGAKDIQQKLGNIGQSATQMGANLTTSMTLPLVGVGAAALTGAASVEEAMVQIQNATGVTTDEAEKLIDSARNIYKDGFGQSLEEVSNALIQVKNNMHSLSGAELEEATRNAVLLAKTFETDVNQVTRGAQSLMTAFGVSAEQAFDKLASSTNLNFTDDLFDQMSEFASVAQRYGYTMDEYFQLMQRGSEAGVYNMDRINNAILEFGLRAEDGSKGTQEAFEQLSASTQILWQDLLAGKATSAEVSQAVVADLMKMEDQVLADQLGIALWGTVWEDNTQQVMYSMYDVNNAIDATSQTMDELAARSEETFGQKWQSFLRTAQDSLVPIGTILIDLANKYLPLVASWIEKAANAFASLPDGMQEAIVMGGLFAAAFGPILMILGNLATGLSSIIGLFGGIGGKLLPLIGRLAPALLRFVPVVGQVITAFTILTAAFKLFGGDSLDGLIQGFNEKKDAVMDKIKEIGDGIKNFFKSLFGIASPSKVFAQYGQWIMQGLINGIGAMLGAVTRLFSNVFNSMKKIATSGLNTLRSSASAAFNSMTSAARSMGNNIKSAVSGAFSSALSSAKGFASKAISLGSDIAGGIAKGVSNGAKKVGSAISSLSQKAMSVFKKDNKIQSPSKAYEEMASWLPAGIRNAIDKGTPMVSDAMSRLSAAAKNTFGDFDLGSAISNVSDLFGYEMPLIDIPSSLPPPNGGGGMVMAGRGGGEFHVHTLNINVQQMTDVTPQYIQNQAERLFFAQARATE